MTSPFGKGAPLGLACANVGRIGKTYCRTDSGYSPGGPPVPRGRATAFCLSTRFDGPSLSGRGRFDRSVLN